jgi:diadenosine tetraphosphate (Ap4A) HIT family hydrolase
MNSPDIRLFASPEAFRYGFEQGLERLLDGGGLNQFILVAANASCEASLFADLRDRLQTRYRQLSATLREAFIHGGLVEESDDDLLVFLKIACIGFDALALTEQRQAGVWEVQFNQLRSFRPLRNSQRPMTSIRAPFDPQGFNFNRPFMQQEALWSGDLLGTHFDLYYNKYPFVDLHCLLVPERQRCLPQVHRQGMHARVWRLVQLLADRLPGIRVGYNALGAFASVNHLHYQLFVRDRRLPVEGASWTHNGGVDAYPVDCRLFGSADTAWQYIEELHARNEAYNLLYTPAGMYCMSRRMQGEFRLAGWSSGFSWYEMSGGMITFNHQDFSALQEAQISMELERARLAQVRDR